MFTALTTIVFTNEGVNGMIVKKISMKVRSPNLRQLSMVIEIIYHLEKTLSYVYLITTNIS